MIRTYDFLESSILAEVKRTVYIELDDYHYLEELRMFFYQWVLSRYHAHFPRLIKSDDRCPYETDKMRDSEDSSEATFHGTHFDHWSCYDG